MSLLIQQHLFVADWKSKNFHNWNEADVREDFISGLLALLGYRKGSIMGLEREVSLRVPFQYLGRKQIRIDYKPTLRLRGFWILEAKPGPPVNMSSGEFLQAYLYATHPEVRAQMFVLCNGYEIRVYDSLRSHNWEDAIHVSTQQDAEETFSYLCELLSANTMLNARRNVLKSAIEDLLRVEVGVLAATVREGTIGSA
jgi:hypothetical protein